VLGNLNIGLQLCQLDMCHYNHYKAYSLLDYAEYMEQYISHKLVAHIFHTAIQFLHYMNDNNAFPYAKLLKLFDNSKLFRIFVNNENREIKMGNY
jgi:hypothetical protein